MFCSLWVSWIGRLLSCTSSSYFIVCSYHWRFWRFGGSSSFIRLLPWTWTLRICVKEDYSGRKEYVKLVFPFFFLFLFFFLIEKLVLLSDLLLAEMATRYSKDKYARVKGLKNEPVSHLTLESKKRKLDEGKDETPAPLSIFGTPSSSIPSLEMMTSLLQPLVPKDKWS